jgi:hypothetical protein
VQNPVRIGVHSEPEPDVALVRLRERPYKEAHPGPEDVYLVVEVADTTLAADRRLKLPLYARAGIPEVWLVDVQHDVVHVHREPTADGYRVVRTLRRGDRVAPWPSPTATSTWPTCSADQRHRTSTSSASNSPSCFIAYGLRNARFSVAS